MTEAVVREPRSNDEIEAFFRQGWDIFHSSDASDAYCYWRDRYLRAPTFDASQMLCVWQDGRLAGGCLVHRRSMELGPSRLLTGCIGAVNVHPDYRRRGIAAAILREAARSSAERGYSLLLLDGIPDFYRALGYQDVFDATYAIVDRALAAEAAGGDDVHVRPATPADAETVLALYRRHFGAFGRFERDVARQKHLISAARPDRTLRLALDGRGVVRGYLQPSLHDVNVAGRAVEVVADDWGATAALLREHARVAGQSASPPADLVWSVPPSSAIREAVADRLPVRFETRSRPNQGWMARVASSRALLESIAPLMLGRLTEHNGNGRAPSRGEPGAAAASGLLLGLADGGEAAVWLAIDASRRTAVVTEAPNRSDLPRLALPASVLLPLLFDFRSVRWAVAQLGQAFPLELVSLLERLFPPVDFWIPGTDAF